MVKQWGDPRMIGPMDQASPILSRSRRRIGVTVAIIIVVGILSRLVPMFRSIPYSKEFGDTLWATMFYFWLALLWPRMRWEILFALSLLVTFAIEFLKLVQFDWLERLRSDRVIGFLLGHTFYWHDFACYFAGAILAVVIDRLIFTQATRASRF